MKLNLLLSLKFTFKFHFLDGPQFNVKIFIGVEYECYRGHRFMCSGPDRVLRVTNSGHVKVSWLKHYISSSSFYNIYWKSLYSNLYI